MVCERGRETHEKAVAQRRGKGKGAEKKIHEEEWKRLPAFVRKGGLGP